MQLRAKESTDVKGSSRPSVHGQRAGARSNVLAPSALSTNLFDNQSRQPNDHDHDNQIESSESSEDSELDYSSSSSESSNSSHSSEDEESEEEDLYNDDEEEDEDDAGEDKTKKDTNIPNRGSNGKMVPKKKPRQQAQKVKVQQKPAVLSQEQQQRPSKSQQQSAANGSLQSQNQNGQPPHQQQVHHVKGSENDKEVRQSLEGSVYVVGRSVGKVFYGNLNTQTWRKKQRPPIQIINKSAGGRGQKKKKKVDGPSLVMYIAAAPSLSRGTCGIVDAWDHMDNIGDQTNGPNDPHRLLTCFFPLVIDSPLSLYLERRTLGR